MCGHYLFYLELQICRFAVLLLSLSPLEDITFAAN